MQGDIWDISDHPTVIRATRFAKAAEELLWYGRIFASDVIQTSTWTRWEIPINLPEEFFIPPKHRSRAGTRWIDWLVFDPAEEGAGEAMEKISKRRLQLQKSRGLHVHVRGGQDSSGSVGSVSSHSVFDSDGTDQCSCMGTSNTMCRQCMRPDPRSKRLHNLSTTPQIRGSLPKYPERNAVTSTSAR
jgi:hypothetical protein